MILSETPSKSSLLLYNAALYKISVVFSKLANIKVESLTYCIFYLVEPYNLPFVN